MTYFLLINGAKKAVELEVDGVLLKLDNIRKIYIKARHAEIATEEHLTKTLHSLNKQFHDDEIVRDTERSLFFSGLMIALKDVTFRSTYSQIQEPSKEEAKASRTKLLEAHLLNEAIVNAITRQLESKINNLSKEYNWKDKFSFIKTIDYPLIKYKQLINKIEKNIFLPFENEEKQDILGSLPRPGLSGRSSAPPISWGCWLSASPSPLPIASASASSAPSAGSPSRRSPSNVDTAAPTGSGGSTAPGDAPVDTSSASFRTCPGVCSPAGTGSDWESSNPRCGYRSVRSFP